MFHRKLCSFCKFNCVISNIVKHKRPMRALCAFLSTAADDMDRLQQNPYYAKYQEKLNNKQKENPSKFEETVNQLAVDELKAKQQAKEDAEKLKADAIKKAKEDREKGLDAIMKVGLLADKSTEEVSDLWYEFHKEKDVVFSVIQAQEFVPLKQRCEEFKTFLYPIPRGGGYEFFLQQAEGSDVYFTSLSAYKAHGNEAPYCLLIRHFTELMQSHGIVLMRGEPNQEVLSVFEAQLPVLQLKLISISRHFQYISRNILQSVFEAQLLALQLKLYYGHQAGLKLNLVRQFNNSPETFVYEDLVREFEKYKQDATDHREIFAEGTPV